MTPIMWDRVVTLLGDAALKSFVIFALAGAINATWRRSSAASRHLIWATAVCAAIALPVIGSMLPQWRMPLESGTHGAVSQQSALDAQTPSTGTHAEMPWHRGTPNASSAQSLFAPSAAQQSLRADELPHT